MGNKWQPLTDCIIRVLEHRWGALKCWGKHWSGVKMLFISSMCRSSPPIPYPFCWPERLGKFSPVPQESSLPPCSNCCSPVSDRTKKGYITLQWPLFFTEQKLCISFWDTTLRSSRDPFHHVNSQYRNPGSSSLSSANVGPPVTSHRAVLWNTERSFRSREQGIGSTTVCHPPYICRVHF